MCDTFNHVPEKHIFHQKQRSLNIKAQYLVKDREASNTYTSRNKVFKNGDKVIFLNKHSKKEADEYFTFSHESNSRLIFHRKGCFIIKMDFKGQSTGGNFYFEICVFSRLPGGKRKKHTYSSTEIGEKGSLSVATMMQLEEDDVVEINTRSKEGDVVLKGQLRLMITKTTCEGPGTRLGV